MSYITSADGERVADDSPVLSIACYRRVGVGHYRHVGIVATPENAERWVAGEDVPLVTVYEAAT